MKQMQMQLTSESCEIWSCRCEMMWQMLGADHPMEAHIVDSRAIFERGKTMDAKEGVMSFLEKRKPEYPEKVSSGIAPHYPWKKKPTFKWPEKAE